MTKTFLTASGEEHGLLRKVSNSSKDNCFKYMTPEKREQAIKDKKEDSKLVKARYKNNKESKYGKLEKPYCKYAGDPIELWKFLTGNVYEVPKGLVNEVNDDAKLNKRSDAIDGITGKVTPVDREPEQIHEFVPVGF